MQLFDTHCHIHSDNYALDADEVIAEARGTGVVGQICVGTTAEDSEKALAFVHSRESCWASVGLHPHDARDGEEAFKRMEQLCAGAVHAGKLVAIGECGLDYFYTHSPKDAQEKAIRFQMELALKYDLPLIFHVREAFDDFWPIFDSYKGLRGVLHSFTDSTKNLDMALTRELYIGVNGIATFAKSEAQLAMYREIPMENMVLETDAPFLTPVPLRGKVNQSAYVSYVCRFLADLTGRSPEAIAAQTTQNATTLFRV